MNHPRLEDMKRKIVILNNKPTNRLAIEFYLARAKAAGCFFDSEDEMVNWLRHCVDEESQIVAAIVDCASVELNTQHIPCSEILSNMGIPMIIAASSRDIGDWCEVSKILSNGMPIYLSPS